ncbi:hypothetical protein THAOC_19321 [Thalassiosira oceanica]|uniref:RING-type domain-containing protein n=1 Tax=Thalassiosira oceanica TaxID=159749 RepID=K0SPJ5_THAOC|nr:hypothetical protein THAOC_19321 [Thalassiosira oceanica]|eukprot:EJK60342.1 hypothetical protein THAOC_19321 [Thalassiosira oceanica]
MRAIDVESNECGMCSNCQSYNELFASQAASSQAIAIKEEERKSVLEALTRVKQNCPVCFDSACNGVQCLTAYDYCYKCLGWRHGDAKECLANNPPLGTPATMCPYCLVIYGDDIPYSGKLHHSIAGQCPYKERIKLILLHDTIDKRDNGASARLRITSCAKNNDLWFKYMHENLEAIEDIHLHEQANQLRL